ncbi:MAG: TetR/AcrR family transcriptional regulator [Polyangiaceae bacterium]|nr:TetR/AcrR family transcriptional regulator [Polyangiaceae bacterium]
MEPSLAVPAAPPFKRSLAAQGGQVAAILDAAEACFARSGYAGAAMRAIAEQAGVSKSLLHYHFQSKEHLFVETQMRAYERLAARVAAAVAPIARGEERGLLAFDALFAALRASRDLVLQAELWAGALSNEALRRHVVRLREFFRALLVRSTEQILGPARAQLPMSPEAAADLVWAVLNGLGVELAFGEAPDRIDRAIGALRVLAGIALVPRAPARGSARSPSPHPSPDPAPRKAPKPRRR